VLRKEATCLLRQEFGTVRPIRTNLERETVGIVLAALVTAAVIAAIRIDDEVYDMQEKAFISCCIVVIGTTGGGLVNFTSMSIVWEICSAVVVSGVLAWLVSIVFRVEEKKD
jgi:hypothetical protein